MNMKKDIKAIKLKKRRTRRNLDEIRKRTLQGNNANNENICKLLKPKIKNCITNNRLILANKAIRSETVTRPLFSNIVKEKRKGDININFLNEKCNKETISINYYRDIDNPKSPDSIILFSSSSSEKMVNNISINDTFSDSSSSAALTAVIQTDCSLYNEFMANIVNYVKEFASDFLKTDIIHNYKDSFVISFIRNLIYNETNSPRSHKNKYDKNKLSITGNPETIRQYPNSQSTMNIHDLFEQPWMVSSPFHHETELEKRLSDSSACFSHDSPEYFYYPHRLHQ